MTNRTIWISILVLCAFYVLVWREPAHKSAAAAVKNVSAATASRASLWPPVVEKHLSKISTACNSSISLSAQDIVPAYLVTAHDDDTVYGLVELLAEIYDSGDVFVIHVDAKYPDQHYQSLLFSLSSCHNIHFTSKRLDVQWATWSIVEMELELLRTARRKDLSWNVALILDGSSWPLTTRQERQRWLSALPKDSSSANGGWPTPVCAFGDESGACERTPARCADQSCANMTATPDGGRVLWGTQWARISRLFADYLFTDPSAAQWMEFFKTTVVPDEHFFPSVLYASPYADTATFDLHLYVDFDHSDNCRSYPNKRQGSPCYLGEADFQDLIRLPSRRIFARKFYAQDLVKKKISVAARSRELNRV